MVDISITIPWENREEKLRRGREERCRIFILLGNCREFQIWEWRKRGKGGGQRKKCGRQKGTAREKYRGRERYRRRERERERKGENSTKGSFLNSRNALIDGQRAIECWGLESLLGPGNTFRGWHTPNYLVKVLRSSRSTFHMCVLSHALGLSLIPQ